MIEIKLINEVLQSEEPSFYYMKRIFDDKVIYIIDKEEFEKILKRNELDNE